MILVTGATGKLGQLVIESLLTKVPASEIVAGVRSPEKAASLGARGVTVRELDYGRPDTIDAALRGVDRVLLISSNEVGRRVEQHSAVIDAAKRAGVKLLAYTSILHGDTSKLLLAGEHVATEKAVRASGLPFTFLRNGWYIENYTDNVGPVLQSGVLLGAAGNGKLAPAARADLAEAAAVVLTSDGHAGKAYELAGDTSHTLADIAAAIAGASGKAVAYQNLPAGVYSETLQKFGLPKGFADVLADSDVGVERGELDDTSGDLRRLIGRPTKSLADAVAAALRS